MSGLLETKDLPMLKSVPGTMLAVRLEAPAATPEAREVPVPRPGRGQVLIRMAASPVNPSDVAYLSGGAETRVSYPAVPGFEGSGTVVAAGPGVLPRLWLGQRVLVGAPSGGAWAEYMVAEATRCFPLGRKISLEQGSTLLVNPLTALALLDIARAGHHRAIVNTAAAGALGKMIFRLGEKEGMEVINLVRRREQAEVLRALGARYVLDSTESQFQTQVRDLVGRLNPTLVLDAVGGELASWLFELAPFGSTLVSYGMLSHRAIELHPRQLIGANKRLMGLSLRNWMTERHVIDLARDFLRVRGLANDVLATQIRAGFPLSEVTAALAAAGRETTRGKVLLVADPDAVRLGPRS